MLCTLYFLKIAKISSRKHKKSPICKNRILCHKVLQNCHMRCFYSTDRDPYSLYGN